MKAIAEKTGIVSLDYFLIALALAGTAFAMVAITYGFDSVPGAHDTFHDFRHSIGMACH